MGSRAAPGLPGETSTAPGAGQGVSVPPATSTMTVTLSGDGRAAVTVPRRSRQRVRRHAPDAPTRRRYPRDCRCRQRTRTGRRPDPRLGPDLGPRSAPGPAGGSTACRRAPARQPAARPLGLSARRHGLLRQVGPETPALTAPPALRAHLRRPRPALAVRADHAEPAAVEGRPGPRPPAVGVVALHRCVGRFAETRTRSRTACIPRPPEYDLGGGPGRRASRPEAPRVRRQPVRGISAFKSKPADERPRQPSTSVPPFLLPPPFVPSHTHLRPVSGFAPLSTRPFIKWPASPHLNED